jgi:hypothetical protein
MKKLYAGTEFQYKSNGKEYCKTVVTKVDGSQVKGSRSLNSFAGSTLRRKLKNLQEEIDRGAWEK